MKKLFAIVLSVILLFTCSVGAAALAHNVNGNTPSVPSVEFSFDKVSGKKGDLVLVNFSLNTENSMIGAFEFQYIYNTDFVVPDENPESGEFFTRGSALQGVAHAHNEKDQRLALATANGMRKAGSLAVFAFRLIQDLPVEQEVMSLRFRSEIAHFDEVPFDYNVSVKNYWKKYPPIIGYDAMWGNGAITFSANKQSGMVGEQIVSSFSLNQTYTYIKELEIQITYDTEKLKLCNENSYNSCLIPTKPIMENGEYTFNPETGVFRYVNPEGMTQKISFGLCFEIIAQVEIPEVTLVVPTLVKAPMHSQDEAFVYNVEMESASVEIRPLPYRYEETEKGMKLVKYYKNDSTYTIPGIIDGKYVTEIGENAFKGQTNLKTVTLSAYVTEIHPTAFDGVGEDFVLRGAKNSVAEAYAAQHGIAFQVAYEVAEVITATDVVTNTDVYAQGDLDKDGYINAKDALKVLRNAVGKEEFTLGQKVAADVYKDEKINAKDALSILRRAVGKIKSFDF